MVFFLNLKKKKKSPYPGSAYDLWANPVVYLVGL